MRDDGSLLRRLQLGTTHVQERRALHRKAPFVQVTSVKVCAEARKIKWYLSRCVRPIDHDEIAEAAAYGQQALQREEQGRRARNVVDQHEARAAARVRGGGGSDDALKGSDKLVFVAQRQRQRVSANHAAVLARYVFDREAACVIGLVIYKDQVTTAQFERLQHSIHGAGCILQQGDAARRRANKAGDGAAHAFVVGQRPASHKVVWKSLDAQHLFTRGAQHGRGSCTVTAVVEVRKVLKIEQKVPPYLVSISIRGGGGGSVSPSGDVMAPRDR